MGLPDCSQTILRPPQPRHSRPALPSYGAILQSSSSALHPIRHGRCDPRQGDPPLGDRSVPAQSHAVRTTGRRNFLQHQPHGLFDPFGRHANRLSLNAVADRAEQGHGTTARFQFAGDTDIFHCHCSRAVLRGGLRWGGRAVGGL
jgi:hypothetical protein